MNYFKDVLTLLNSINAKQDEILMLLKNHKKKDPNSLSENFDKNDLTNLFKNVRITTPERSFIIEDKKSDIFDVAKIKKNCMHITDNVNIVKVVFPTGASKYSELVESVGLEIDKAEHQFGDDTICVKFVETECMDFDKRLFVSLYGKGKTYEEACKDYCKQISGQTLHALESDKATIYQIPVIYDLNTKNSDINASNIRSRKYYLNKLLSFGFNIDKQIDDNGNIAIRFEGISWNDDSMPIGRGLLYEEACKDYCKQITGKTLIIRKSGKFLDIPKDLYRQEYDFDNSNKYVKILESTGFKIEANFREMDKRILVSYKHGEISDGVCLSGEYGVGDTYEEACKDYCKRIAGKTLIFNAMGKDRFSYQVPDIFYNN